jgi:hypothetical protein
MPTPAWNPVRPPSCSSWSAVIPACTRCGQRDRRGRRVAGNSGQPGRRVTSKTVVILAGPRYPSASVESAAPPSVEELRQVVPVSDMRRRLGAGPARCRMAGGYWLPTEAAGSSVSRSEPSNALLPPAARTGRGSVDANMRVVTTYRPRRLGRVRPGLALHWFRAALHHSPARRTNGHTALTTVAHRFHLPAPSAGKPLLLTYTPVVDSVAGQPAAEDEGVLQ